MGDSIEIIPTVVPKNAGEFADAVAIVKKFTNAIHLDIDDGTFTPALSWPFVAPGEFVPFDIGFMGIGVEVHLMVSEPADVGRALSGASSIIGHIESFKSAHDAIDTLKMWRDNGSGVGISILATTPIEAFAPVIDVCDFVQVMSIETIGAQGASFDLRALVRVADLHVRYPQACIAVDGGVSLTNIAELVHKGARRFAVGSAIMKSEDPALAFEALHAIGKAALI